jgi:hypothetical protein
VYHLFVTSQSVLDETTVKFLNLHSKSPKFSSLLLAHASIVKYGLIVVCIVLTLGVGQHCDVLVLWHFCSNRITLIGSDVRYMVMAQGTAK